MSAALYACPDCLATITERVWRDGRWLCADCARHAVTTAHHATPAPCDLCATVAPLWRTAGDWICADCHGWTPADAAAAARQFPRTPCPDCDPAEHAAWATAARARAAEVIDR